MTPNKFDSIIREKLDAAEMSPSGGHREALFAKRAAMRSQSKGATGFFSKGFFVITSALLLGISWLWVNQNTLNSGVQADPITLSETSQPDMNSFTQKKKTRHNTESENQNSLASQSEHQDEYTMAHSEEPSATQTQKATIQTPAQQLPINTTAIGIRNAGTEASPNMPFESGISMHQDRPKALMFELASPLTRNLGPIMLNKRLAPLPVESQPELNFSKPKHGRPLKPEIDLILGGGLWLNERDNELEQMPGYMNQIQLRGRVALNSRLSFMTGIGLQTLGTRVDYQNVQRENQMQVDTSHGFIIDPSGNQTPITRFDTSYITNITDHSYQGMNRYTCIHIPVSLYYRVQKKRHRFYAHAGVLIAIHTQSSGVYLPEESFSVQPFDNQKTAFNATRSMGYHGGLGYAYAMSRNWALFAELNYAAQRLQSRSAASETTNRIHVLGLGLGIQYGF